MHSQISSYIVLFVQASLILIAKADETDAVLVEHRVELAIEYDKQGETILTWSENETEYAISFQDLEGCAQVWEQIMLAQGKTEDELLVVSEAVDQDV